MSRLIDADEMKKKLDMETLDGQRIAFFIDEQPTIELIQCKDCEYADLHDGEYRLCLLTGTWKKLDHFCSDGEREKER